MTGQPRNSARADLPTHGSRPDWLKPELERFVQDGSFKELRRHLGADEAAFTYFSNRQIERFSLEKVGATCCDCGRGTEGQVGRVEWDYRFPDLKLSVVEGLGALGHVHSDHHRHGLFRTHHAVCRGCMRRWRIRRLMGGAVLVPGILGIAFGLAMGVLASLLYLGGTFSPSDRRLVAMSIPLLFAAAVVALILWRIGIWLRIPGPLRRVAGPPIEIKKMKRHSVSELREEMSLDGED